ncbi:MAG: hypothetical protein ABJP87_04400 [Bauldia litoralis]|uniref:hypothetical protein n=1 Tax=Bauldia litoralis TaxID=665467 RepID=UPI003298A0BE
MIAVNVRIQNLDALRSNFHRAPVTALRYLSKAVRASIFEIETHAVDSNFRFKTPRARRTGMLQQSFAFGRSFAQGGLYASIGPTVGYAPYVYFGTHRGIRPNPYMDRIASSAEPEVNRHFEKAVDLFVKDIADV